jgi:hypothetical protein
MSKLIGPSRLVAALSGAISASARGARVAATTILVQR